MYKPIAIVLFFFIFTYNINAQITAYKLSNKGTTITGNEKKIANPKPGKFIQDKMYSTIDILEYDFLNLKIESMKDSMQTITDSIAADNINQKLTSEERENLKKQVKGFNTKIVQTSSLADSFYRAYIKDYIQYRNRNLFLGPTRAKAFFEMAYENNPDFFKPLSNAGLSFGTNTSALYSEIVSGNMALFRVSLGTMVSKSGNDDPQEEKQEEAYQRLVSYGGNTVLTFEYPYAYIHSDDNRYNLIGRLLIKGTADFPAFGTNSDSWAGSLSYGFDLYGDATLSNQKLRFFGNFGLARFHSTDVFKTNLGIDNANFMFGQLTLGLVFLNNFKLSFVVSTFSNENTLRNKKVVAGGQVLR